MSVSRLGFEVDSSQAKGASVDLDKLTSSAQRAEKAERGLAASSKQADTATGQLARSARDTATATSQLERTTDMAAAAQGRAVVATQATTAALHAQSVAMRQNSMMTRQLMFQMVDIGQTIPLAFQSPIHAVQNLGFQIAQIGQLYYGQGGMGAALRDMTSMTARFAMRLAPLGVVVGGTTAALIGMRNAINDNSDVTVSFGDVALATWQVIRDGIYTILRPAISAIAPFAEQAWNATIDVTRQAGNAIVSIFVGAYRIITDLWKDLPNALAGYAKMAVNAVIAEMNQPLLSINGRTIIGGLGLSELQLSDAETAATQGVRGIGQRDFMEEFFGAVSVRARQNALRPSEDEVKRAQKEAARQVESYEKLVRSAEQFIQKQEMERRAIGMTAEAAARLRFEQELLNKAANDNINLTPQQRAEIQNLASAMAEAQTNTNSLREAFEFAKETTRGFFSDLRRGLRQGEGLWDAFRSAALNAIDRVTDRLMNNLVDAIFQTRRAVGSLGGGGGFFSGIFGSIGRLFGFADGAAFRAGQVTAFANGGIVSQPTIFPMANGMGLMGEAGPEAVMPLKRGPNGRLGVEVVNKTEAEPMNGNIQVDVQVGVQNGNLVPLVTAVSGQVAGQQIKAFNRQLRPRMQTLQTRGK